MKTDKSTFFKIKIPNKGYHCENGNEELHIEKNLNFLCECGQTHNSKEAHAYIQFPSENKTLYSCPNNKFLFVLVKPTGFFKIKGLKTIASYEVKDESELNIILADIESRKRKD
jgi:hypothetical protein